jgi:hypothetical protein
MWGHELAPDRAVVKIAVGSPSRHICGSLTIAGASFANIAFDAVEQPLIKVDGTFA